MRVLCQFLAKKSQNTWKTKISCMWFILRCKTRFRRSDNQTWRLVLTHPIKNTFQMAVPASSIPTELMKLSPPQALSSAKQNNPFFPLKKVEALSEKAKFSCEHRIKDHQAAFSEIDNMCTDIDLEIHPTRCNSLLVIRGKTSNLFHIHGTQIGPSSPTLHVPKSSLGASV